MNLYLSILKLKSSCRFLFRDKFVVTLRLAKTYSSVFNFFMLISIDINEKAH